MKSTNPLMWRALSMAVAALLLASGPASAVPIGQLGILDSTANGGINPVTGAAWAPGDQYRLIFVSSTFRDASSFNIADYNTHVQNAANAAGLGSVTWNAVASTNAGEGGGALTIDARDNTGTNFTITPVGTSIFLIDGVTKIADNYTDLWDGTIDAAVNRTELNTPYLPPANSPFGQFGGVWAGTTASGTNRGNGPSPGGPLAGLGRAIDTTSQWVRRADINPHNNAVLGFYAISDVLTIPGAGGGDAIPEPATATLGLLVAGGLMLRRRRAA